MSACRWVASDKARIVVGRHAEDCYRDQCPGCQPCTDPHCRVCGIAHADGACPECVGATRDDLREIARLCGELPEEVEHRGIDGEAMVLLGPAADPEARGHLEASIAAGRVPADYLDAADGDNHPLFVLGTWDMVWRDALEHDEPEDRLTIASAVDYLDRQMTYMAGYEHVPFEDFARDLRRCRTHVEAVLHDGEQVDTGAPCLRCGVRQVREWGKLQAADGWRCPKCRTFSTPAQYALAVRDDYETQRDADAFEWLPALDCSVLTGATRGSITGWASKGKVKRRREFGRTVYRVADVRAMLDGEVLAVGDSVP